MSIPLRMCRVCGLEAHTEADLELFKKHEPSWLGRRNLCKKCNSSYERERMRKTAKFIKIFRARSPDGIIRCHFCDEEITKLKESNSDSLNIHSLDENHENWAPANKVPTHHSCHLGYHKTGRKMARKDLPIDEIRNLYEGGMSSLEIARRLGVSWITILRRLREMGVEIKKPGRYTAEGYVRPIWR